MLINKIKNRISEAATEACGYSPLTKVVSEEEINRILEQESGWMPLPEPYRVSAENAQPKETPLTEQPQTNADRIRSMTDEELAEWFNTVTKDVLGGSTWNKKGWLKWLKAESEE
jgi:hypothetical protein